VGIQARLKKELGIDRVGERVRDDDGYRYPYAREGKLSGIFTTATTRQMMLAQQQDFAITHVVVQKGGPKAEVRDRLVLPSNSVADEAGEYPPTTRVFEVREVLNPGEANKWTLYSVEEVIG
jgi:hypothetical protein